MTASSPRRRFRSFIRYLADNNPFYLLSAASMLLACLLLSNTTTWSPIAARKLVALIVTVNVYELIVVGLGLYLIARPGNRRQNHTRDGIMLLILEAVFMADIGFLNSEVYTENLRLGLAVNGALLAVAAVKLVAIFRVLKIPLASPAFALIAVTMTTLLGHAAVFKVIGDQHHGRLPDGVLYAAWWGVGVLLAAYALLTRYTAAVDFRGRRPDAANGAIGHVLMVLMLASLAGHLGTSHWIYSCPFQAPDVSPVLIGLAVVMAGVRASAFAGRRDLATLSALLPVAAVFTAQSPSGPLAAALQPWSVTPLMLTATAAYLALVYCFAIRRFVRYAALGMAAAAAYAFGPTLATLGHFADRTYTLLASAINRMTPRTQGAWGTLALIGAFVLLAAGAAVSLLRPHDDDDAAPPPLNPAGGPPMAVAAVEV